MEKINIDIRPVTVDKLTLFKDEELAKRTARIITLLFCIEDNITRLQRELNEVLALKDFLEKELKNAELAILLKKDDLVRVICPVCKGSGLKPTDTTSGRITSNRTNSAFETLGKRNVLPEEDPHLQCNHCKGAKYIIMERYKG